MVGDSGLSADALESARSALAARDRDLAEADRELADAVAGAHTAATEAIRRLDAVGAEIESAVSRHAALAGDTAVGTREFARYLIAKQREIIDIVTRARADAAAKAVVLRGLRDRFRTG
jgi:Domain of unknown function (DUF4226)